MKWIKDIKRRMGAKRRRREDVVRRSNAYFEKMEKLMREERPYLDPELTIGDMCRMLGTNRTYISLSLSSRNTNFNRYVNGYRMWYMENCLCEEKRSYGQEDIAVMSGFANSRMMNRTLLRERGKTYFEIKKGDKNTPVTKN